VALKLHLGCGANALPGWTNIDLDSDVADIRQDLTQPLPFADASVELIYTEHFVEHLTRAAGVALFRECARVLRPGGCMRISTPNLATVVRIYMNGPLDFWRPVGWLPASSAQLLNEGLRLWGHQYVYDAQDLAMALSEAGLPGARVATYRQSSRAELGGLECRPYLDDLIMEVVR
jgi:predicted SAM-dependent methyltransferase